VSTSFKGGSESRVAFVDNAEVGTKFHPIRTSFGWGRSIQRRILILLTFCGARHGCLPSTNHFKESCLLETFATAPELDGPVRVLECERFHILRPRRGPLESTDLSCTDGRESCQSHWSRVTQRSWTLSGALSRCIAVQ
jgi:hypothetical protein